LPNKRRYHSEVFSRKVVGGCAMGLFRHESPLRGRLAAHDSNPCGPSSWEDLRVRLLSPGCAQWGLKGAGGPMIIKRGAALNSPVGITLAFNVFHARFEPRRKCGTIHSFSRRPVGLIEGAVAFRHGGPRQDWWRRRSTALSRPGRNTMWVGSK